MRNLSCLAVVLLATASLFGQAATSVQNSNHLAYSSSLPDSPSTELIASSAVLNPMPKPAPEFAPAGFVASVPNKPVRIERPNPFHSKSWWTLTAVEHGAAAFDAWTTRQAISRGAVELNPTLRPFANSSAIYPAAQVFPAGMDFLSAELMRSSHPWMRKLWWLPQTASAAGSLVAGFHNQGVQRQ